MKKQILFGLLATSLLFGCTGPKPLYSWSDYQERTYNYVKNSSDENLESLLKSYENIISKQNGTRKTVPPGVCADYGYLLYKQGQHEKGLALLEKEISLYPESSIFISRIIKNLQNENK